MRISLLLQREPFGIILEKTLSRFWQEQYGHEFHVRWIQHQPNLSSMRQRGEQGWLCNIYLNAIFTPGIEPTALLPITREFSHSPVWWRRPFQELYVKLATAPWGAPWLSQMGLGVLPPHPEAKTQLIVAGNHKIRILDHRARMAYTILKDGFETTFFLQELNTRQLARRLGLSIPELVDISPDGNWFSERYLNATPLNRLRDPGQARAALHSTVKMLQNLYSQTAQVEPLPVYAGRLFQQIKDLLITALLLSGQQASLLRTVNKLYDQLFDNHPAATTQVTTVITHGDFQPANILVEQDKTWLIDWEYAGRRQLCYDAFVFGLRSRHPRGLAKRLERFVVAGPQPDFPEVDLELADVNLRQPGQRRQLVCLFALEELLLRLRENENALFFKPDASLELLHEEVQTWLFYKNAF